MATNSFQKSLAENRQAIFDGLSNPNPYARTQTIGLLIEHKAFDEEFVDAVMPLLDDDAPTIFGLKVKDAAHDFIAARLQRT